MARTFNAYEKATIKNSAKAVAHYQAKNLKLEEKIEELRKEQEMNNVYIEQYSKPVKEMTGYGPLELCEKRSRGTQNDWVFIYPDTIVPPSENEEKPSDLNLGEEAPEIKNNLNVASSENEEEPIGTVYPPEMERDTEELEDTLEDDEDIFKEEEF